MNPKRILLIDNWNNIEWLVPLSIYFCGFRMLLEVANTLVTISMASPKADGYGPEIITRGRY